MTRETFYFRHDCNARTDRKIINIIMKHGMQGVGVYWCVVEMLYEEGGYLPLEYERISFELRTEVRIIESVIRDFELFQFDENRFWSESVLERLQERCDRSEKARHSINKRWNKFSKHTNVIRTNNDSNTKKNSIVKNSIEKNIQKKFVIPSLEEIKTYCKERNNSINPQTFIDHYTGNGWMVGKNKMKDWKAVIRTWETRGGNNGTGNATFKRQIRTERDAINEAACDEADRIARDYYAKHPPADGNT